MFLLNLMYKNGLMVFYKCFMLISKGTGHSFEQKREKKVTEFFKTMLKKDFLDITFSHFRLNLGQFFLDLYFARILGQFVVEKIRPMSKISTKCRNFAQSGRPVSM
jgi:hypothetical protein